jgi:hypothetical protein
MLASIVAEAPILPAAVYIRLRHETNLAAMTQELASLRFSILLLARWEGSRSLSKESLAELRTELAHLRALYLEKIDDTAMTFGVQQAIETKETVERTVAPPRRC